jgi:hypothetical protein
MEMIEKAKIKALLAGDLSEAEAQRLLEELDSGDLERIFGEDELTARMTAYRERHTLASKGAPQMSSAEVDRMWTQISNAASRQSPLISRVRQGLNDGLEWLRETLTLAPLSTYAATMTLMLILLIVPLQLVRSPQHPQSDAGVKGLATEAPATIQFAIVGTNGILERPERPLRETDTLAFRISVEKSGYYSLYMVHAAGIDPIIVDRLLSPGPHDLQEAYTLGGNQGDNHLVLVYSDQSAPSGQETRLALIRQAVLNTVSALSMAGRTLTLHTQLIEVTQ